MGRGVRVFHAPGQSPYSVLVEQRGVDQLLLLESQVKYVHIMYIRITGVFCQNRGVFSPLNLEEPGTELV